MAAPTNLHRDLGRIEGKLDAVIGEMRRDVRRAHTRLDDHEVRIETIEKREDERAGGLKVLRLVWAIATAFIGWVAGTVGGMYLK